MKLRRRIPMPFSLTIRSFVLASALLLMLVSTALAAAPVPVSGYEIFLGDNCVIKGTPATCGATFTGWTGVTGSGGWLPFPGTRGGAWSLQVNYTGQPMFNGSVTIVGGKWSFFFFDGTVLYGKVISGTVTWPADANTSIGCGDGVAVGEASLTLAGAGDASLTGCLHDLPKGAVIPPTVWGSFNF